MSIADLPWRDIVSCHQAFNRTCIDLLACGHLIDGHRHEGQPDPSKRIVMPDKRRRCWKCHKGLDFTMEERTAQAHYNWVPE